MLPIAAFLFAPLHFLHWPNLLPLFTSPPMTLVERIGTLSAPTIELVGDPSSMPQNNGVVVDKHLEQSKDKQIKRWRRPVSSRASLPNQTPILLSGAGSLRRHPFKG